MAKNQYGLPDSEMQALGLMDPAELQQPSTSAGIVNNAEKSAESVMPKIQGTDEIKPNLPPRGSAAFHANMPQITAAPGTHDYFVQHQQRLDYENAHPWGTPISEHPGIGGKIAHAFAKAGNIAGDIFAPGTMALIPGTQLNREQQGREFEAGAERTAKEESEQAEQGARTKELGAQTELEQEQAEKLRNPQPQPKEEQWELMPGFTGPNGEPLEIEKNSGQARFAPGITNAIQKQPEHTPTEFETDYKQYLKDNNFPDTSHNRLLFRKEWEVAKNAVTIRGQNMTDARQREQNQIARETKETQKTAADETALGGVNADMDRLATAANAIAQHPGLGGITGIRGKIPNIPGSQAADAEALLGNLKSQVAFGVLQNMRNQSKTGGALGQVSDREQELLMNNLAALDKAQSYEQMKKSLGDIVTYTNQAKARARDALMRSHPGEKPTSGQEIHYKIVNGQLVKQ